MTVEAPPAEHVYGKRWPGPHQRFPHADTTGLQIRPEVDPRPNMPPVFNQGALGSCTANATAACFQYDAIQDGHDCGRLSRLWIYYFERELEHSLGRGDVGAIGHDAFRVARHGIPDEKLWPYDITRFEDRPPNEPRAYRLTKPVHAPAQSQTALKQVLSNGQTAAFGFVVFESFESQHVAQTGVVPIPGPGERALGNHEMLLVGYLKNEPHYALVRNSWGDWGLGGYCLFPWAYLLDRNLCSDFRTIVRAPAN